MTPETESQPEAPADTPAGEGLVSPPCPLKIIQILIAPENATWQGVLLGLGHDGNVYVAVGCGWEPYLEGKISRENTQDDLPQ